MKIAMLLPGSIDDGSWNTNAYNGLMELKDAGYEVAFTEKVPIPNMEELMRSYADNGFEFIIGHGFEFGDPTLKVAPDYPEVNFFVFGKNPPGAEIPQNVGFVDQKEYEAAYLAGALAGLMTETDVVGFIGGANSPGQQNNIYAFTEGAAYTNPDCKVLGVITGDFHDPEKGKESALAQMENGADIITHTADSTGLGAMEAAKSRGVKIIGYGDQYEFAPNLVMTGIQAFIPEVIVSQVSLIEEGTFGGSVWKCGIKEQVTDLAPYHEMESVIPDEVKAQIADLREKIISGEVVVPEYSSMQ